MTVSYDKLNKQQRAVCEHLDGPLLVVGGPGSGKTTVVRHRYEQLVESGVDPAHVLVTTFSREAAAELRRRIDTETADATIGTIHSVFYQIVRDHYDKLGYETGNINLYQREDVDALLEEIVRDLMPRLGSGNLEDTITFYRINIDRVRTKGMTPNDVEDAMNAGDISFTKMAGGNQLDVFPEAAEHVPGVFREFLHRMYEQNAIDYTGMQYKAYVVLKNNQDTLQAYRDRYQHILVDEAQDLSYVQWKILDLLAEEHENLCMIGDDCQNIYSWRGSDYKYLQEFREKYRAATFTLPVNYRSTQQILDAVNRVMPHLETVEEKHLVADRGVENVSMGQPTIFAADNAHLERNRIAREIGDLVNEQEYAPEDIAILLRTAGRNGARIAAYQQVLESMRLEASGARGFKFLDRKEVKWIFSYLKAFLNPDDDIVVWNTLLRVDGIGQETLSSIAEAKPEDVPLLAYIEQLSPANAINGLSAEKLQRLQNAADCIRSIEGVDNIVEHIKTRTGLDEKLTEWNGDPDTRRMNLMAVQDALSEYPATRQGISDFFDHISNTAPEEEKSGVTVTTLHGAKGKEWPVVFIPELRDGLLPHDMADAEEEKRLFYVGLSRAGEKAYLSYHDRASPFLAYLQD